MSNLEIQIEQDRTAFTPGEEIAGSAKWQLDNSQEYLELTLYWRTEGKGTQDIGIVETLRFDNPESFGEREFKLRLPSGPYSFSGKLISIIWAFELSVSQGKDSLRKEITISPTKEEIVFTDSTCDSGPDKSKGGLSKFINRFKFRRT